MAANEAVAFLEGSFLKECLVIPGVTDVSFNGEHFFYATNVGGRKRLPLEESTQEVGAFLRQIANLTERQFSFSSPILDVSFGRYRLNAVFTSLARVHNEKSFSFSLRLANGETVLENDPAFFGEGKEILLEALRKNESIVIGGQTSTGKTELEKWCLFHLEPNKRVIVIDNVEELDMVNNPAIDLTTWLVNESLPEATFPSLIRNALRNNPDYIVVAEARGKEMLDALTSVMSGHAIILSIHAQTLEQMPVRMARLAMLGNERLYQEDLLSDIGAHFRYFVYLRKTLTDEGDIERFIDEIAYFQESKGTLLPLYQRGLA
jgi:pilus assembly protein CpaF